MLLERGIILPKRRAPLVQRLDELMSGEMPISARAVRLLGDRRGEWASLDRRIKAYDDELAALTRDDAHARALATIPGIGVINATVLLAAVGDASAFARGRDLAAWLGLTLRQQLGDFVAAYNFGRRLKTLKALTPYEAICKAWQNEPERFTSNPHHQMPGSNTFLAALRCDRSNAPYVLDGPIKGMTFTAWVEQCLSPTLKPGDVVIMDNLARHKGKAVRRAIRQARVDLLFLPPYSPDLNPIEQVFAKLKTLLR